MPEPQTLFNDLNEEDVLMSEREEMSQVFFRETVRARIEASKIKSLEDKVGVMMKEFLNYF